jgi:transcriptional regulatory protein LevR
LPADFPRFQGEGYSESPDNKGLIMKRILQITLRSKVNLRKTRQIISACQSFIAEIQDRLVRILHLEMLVWLISHRFAETFFGGAAR